MQMPDLVVDRYQVALLKGDRAGMDRAVALAAKTPGAEDLVANQESFGAAYVGHLQQTRMHSGFAVRLAEQAGLHERAALFQSGAAVREGFSGNVDASRRSATAALGLSKGKEVEYGAAFAEAPGGRRPRGSSDGRGSGKALPGGHIGEVLLRALAARFGRFGSIRSYERC